jgi:hypothetical protein
MRTTLVVVVIVFVINFKICLWFGESKCRQEELGEKELADARHVRQDNLSVSLALA